MLNNSNHVIKILNQKKKGKTIFNGHKNKNMFKQKIQYINIYKSRA